MFQHVWYHLGVWKYGITKRNRNVVDQNGECTGNEEAADIRIQSDQIVGNDDQQKRRYDIDR